MVPPPPTPARRALALAIALGLAALLAVVPAAGGGGRCGEHAWCDASLDPDARAALLVAAMTREQKFELMGGDDPFGVFTGDPATGFSRGIPGLGIPDLYLNDGPAGLRARPGGTTGMPAPVALAATFDPEAAFAFGDVLGDEATKRRVDLVLAPMINIVRYPGSGRAFETYGEDPHLAARLAAAFVEGLQRDRGPGVGRVIANPKHFVANNHEVNRFTVSAQVGDRTLREIYLPAFEAAVNEAGAGSVMLAYNRVNGRHMTENGPLVNGLLKGEWGFEGFALTDWGLAQRSTAEAANNGTDLEMPYRWWYHPAQLALAVDSGRVSIETIDDHVRRILRTMFAFGVFDREAYPLDGAIDFGAHAAAARAIEADGIVLLENDPLGGAPLLPLDTTTVSSIALIGPEADAYVHGGGSSAVEPLDPVTPCEGLTERAGAAGIAVTCDDGSDRERAKQVAAAADVAIVVASDAATEFLDRPCLSLRCATPERDQDGLIADVAAANPRTVVLLETSGPVLMPWLDDVASVLEAWYPGQEGGHAIAAVIFGDAEPGGRLPVTFPARDEDTPFWGHPERWPGVAEQAHYSEGIFVGYRFYDEMGIAPLFPFGHGLGYTTFDYRNPLVVETPGGVRAGVEVANTGSRAGATVVQLYLGKPETTLEQPPRWLAGFRKVALAPGEARRVWFTLDDRALASWDEAAGAWVVGTGCYRVMFGASSRDIRAEGAFARGAACPA